MVSIGESSHFYTLCFKFFFQSQLGNASYKQCRPSLPQSMSYIFIPNCLSTCPSEPSSCFYLLGVFRSWLCPPAFRIGFCPSCLGSDLFRLLSAWHNPATLQFSVFPDILIFITLSSPTKMTSIISVLWDPLKQNLFDGVSQVRTWVMEGPHSISDNR